MEHILKKVKNIFEDNYFSGGREKVAYHIVILAILSVHLVYAILYYLVGMMSFVYYNIGIVIFYALINWLIVLEKYKPVVFLVHLEIILYVLTSVVCCGWECNIAIYLVGCASLIYFNPFSRAYIVYLIAIFECIAYIIAYVYSQGHIPFYEMSQHSLTILSIMNGIVAFLTIFFCAIISQITIDAATTSTNRVIHHGLTGLCEKNYLLQYVEHCINKNKSPKYLLLYVKIVNFPLYRELFGEEHSNILLADFANSLKIAITDFEIIGHFSDDEFGILIEEKKYDNKCIIQSLHHLREQYSNEGYKMNLCVGAYMIEDSKESIHVIVERAHMAQQKAQVLKTSDIILYDNSMLEKRKAEANILAEFEYALKNNQFEMYLQPQIDVNGNVHGAEALVRWNHPTRGLLFPNDFIPVLENAGMIYQLDQYIWDKAAQKLKDWKIQGKEQLCISVNISAMDFYQFDLYQHFTNLVKTYDINPSKLNLEITETVLMKDIDIHIDKIQMLRAYGFIFEIDDFGSGYSSLNMLKDLNLDILKIDMGFIRNMTYGDRNCAIVETIIELAKNLKMGTIAEGVETEEQLGILKEYGSNFFQGYYYSKPIPVTEFEKKYCC